jgi:hypothetical protein
MMKPVRILMVLLFVFSGSAPVRGHGLRAVDLEGGTGVAVRYDHGTPAAFCEVAKSKSFRPERALNPSRRA